MTARWRVLVVDDDETIRTNTKKDLESEELSADGSTCIVDLEASFNDALERLAETHYDLVVLDIRDDTLEAEEIDEGGRTTADVGLDIGEEIRALRFVPIIYYSAVAQHAVPKPPFVSVVSKGEGPERLVDVVKEVFESGLPSVHQALIGHVEKVTRDFMAEFVEANWDQMSTAERRGDMAHLLSRRLGSSLANGGAVLAKGLEDEPAVDVAGTSTVHPMRCYIIPPVGDLIAGALLHGPRLLPAVPEGGGGGGGAEGEEGDGAVAGAAPSPECCYVVLTPSCDLVAEHPKADYVVVAECVPLEECPEYEKLAKARNEHHGPGDYVMSGAVKDALTKVFTNNRSGRPQDRDYFLPAAWQLPALVVDFQRIAHLPHGDLTAYTRPAQLDGPYAEALIAKAVRYLGRVGTPDLDVEYLLSVT